VIFQTNLCTERAESNKIVSCSCVLLRSQNGLNRQWFRCRLYHPTWTSENVSGNSLPGNWFLAAHQRRTLSLQKRELFSSSLWVYSYSSTQLVGQLKTWDREMRHKKSRAENARKSSMESELTINSTNRRKRVVHFKNKFVMRNSKNQNYMKL